MDPNDQPPKESKGVPEIVVSFQGIPLDRAPDHLKPYLVEGIDGAFLSGAEISPAIGKINECWTLSRNGQEAHSVMVERPAPNPADVMEDFLRRAGIEIDPVKRQLLDMYRERCEEAVLHIPFAECTCGVSVNGQSARGSIAGAYHREGCPARKEWDEGRGAMLRGSATQ